MNHNVGILIMSIAATVGNMTGIFTAYMLGGEVWDLEFTLITFFVVEVIVLIFSFLLYSKLRKKSQDEQNIGAY